MTENREQPKVIQFGPFEADLRTQELKKQGEPLRVYGQPFQILKMLLERPGELVTREELRQALWPSDTFVDFEHGLNAAVNRVREALGDNADHSRYIETLPRRGYRFVGAITPPQSPVQATATIEEKQEAVPKEGKRIRWVVGLGLAGACALLSVGFFWVRSSVRVPRVLSYRQLTTGHQLRGTAPCGLNLPLITDGLRIFFAEPSSPLSEVSVSGGEVAKVSSPFKCFAFSDISPDKTELLGSPQPDWPATDQPLWSLSVVSGQARRLGNLNGHAGAWSPDGNRVAYANGNLISSSSDVYIASKDGSDPRKLVSFEKRYVESVRWSPDGNSLRMILCEDGATSLWEVSTYGTNPRRLTPPGVTDNVLEQSWTPDGRYSLLTAGTDIWVIREARSRLLDSTANAVRLTIGDMNFSHPTTSPDGKQIFAIGGQRRGELVRYDLRLQRLEPFLSGISVEFLDFSRDGKRVTYATFPEGVLWRSNVDGSDRMQLTMHPLFAALPQWSPDGKRIAFTGWVPPEHGKIYTVSAEGGEPEVVSQGHSDAGDATWSPDGNSLIFNQPGAYSAESAPQIVSVDLQTGHVSNIPGSEGMASPRLSPDGRFIVALDTPHPSKLFLFDQQTQKWTTLLDSKLTSFDWPQWSGDSRFVYVSEIMPGTRGFSLYRLAVANKKLERVALVEVPDGLTGLWEHWVGIAPDGSPLLLRDRSIQEIYALAVDLP